MYYTLLAPSERRQLREKAQSLWPQDSERHYRYLLYTQDQKRRELVKDKTWRTNISRGEMHAAMLWGGATWLLNGGMLSWVTRWMACDGLSAALHAKFPFLMRRYLWWIQLSIVLVVLASFYWVFAKLTASPLDQVPKIWQVAWQRLIPTSIPFSLR